MAEKEQNPPPATPPAKSNTALVDEIGTLTYPRAVTNFGKENALAVMHKVATLGGHGMFVDDEFKSPIFGGLGMPSAEVVKPPQKEDYDNLPDSDFFYQRLLKSTRSTKSRRWRLASQSTIYTKSLRNSLSE
jgi:hypothetical protein